MNKVYYDITKLKIIEHNATVSINSHKIHNNCISLASTGIQNIQDGQIPGH